MKGGEGQNVACVKPIVLCPTAEDCNSLPRRKSTATVGYEYEGQDSNEDRDQVIGVIEAKRK